MSAIDHLQESTSILSDVHMGSEDILGELQSEEPIYGGVLDNVVSSDRDLPTPKFKDILSAVSTLDTKVYENKALEFDPFYNRSLDAIPIIKKFITDRGLIIYGGTAVDYALRLHGDNIYPDAALAIPDLDFYSPNSVQDSYDLTKILYDNGFTEARCIGAMYVITMRVDIGDNHFLADISYIPPEIFLSLPTIVYEGMKCIDPIFQKIDFHSCLGYPYDNPPKEVIFDKWKKYISRFNKLHKYYPTPLVKYHQPSYVAIQHHMPKDTLLGGLGAYAAYMTKYATYAHLDAKSPNGNLIIDDKIAYNIPGFAAVTLVSFDPTTAINELGVTEVKKYRSYINVIPKHTAFTIDGVPFKIYNIGNKLISSQRLSIGDKFIHVVGIQILLMQLLTSAHMDSANSAFYYDCYENLLKLIECTAKSIDITTTHLIPTVHVYGRDNKSDIYDALIERTKADRHMPFESTPTPKGYYPSRGNQPETFSYSSNKYFARDGGEIIPASS